MRHRFPRSVYDHGTEPDARFTLANQRTFLAWIRTGLALIAVGVALEAFAENLPSPGRRVASALMVLAGVIAPVQAWLGWRRTELAMRTGRPLPPDSGSLPLMILTIIAGVLILATILVAQ